MSLGSSRVDDCFSSNWRIYLEHVRLWSVPVDVVWLSSLIRAAANCETTVSLLQADFLGCEQAHAESATTSARVFDEWMVTDDEVETKDMSNTNLPEMRVVQASSWLRQTATCLPFFVLLYLVVLS